MASWSAQRQAAAAGIGFVVLLVISSAFIGSPPKFDASAEKVTSTFHDDHRRILIGLLISGAAIPFFIWFLAHFVAAVRAAGERALAFAILFGAIGGGAIAVSGDAVLATLAQSASTGGDPGTIRTLWQLNGMLGGRFEWLLLAAVLATGVAALRGAVPGWLGWISWAAAVLLLLGAVSIKASGAFSPNNVFAFLGFIGFLVWTVSSSVALWRAAPSTSEAPHAAAMSV
jgi:hypothetical protein